MIPPCMPRAPRNTPGGLAYHVLNRANGRLKLFTEEEDFLAFEQVLVLAHRRVPVRILAWCVMSNHWHFVLWPRRDGEVGAFIRWLTLTHAQRWKHAHGAVGHGHLYQGRFKSFPIEQDEHLLTAIRYVERNPVAAGAAGRAEDWRWGSCHVRQARTHELKPLLGNWPIERPRRWLQIVNSPLHETEARMVKDSIQRGRPLGAEPWVASTASSLGLEQTLRARGRPKGWRKRKAVVKIGEKR
jgi:putative transposase